MFEENLILVDVEAKNNIELLEKLSDYVYGLKRVKESFKEAVINREDGFPTGLTMKCINIAIPHTDSKHVTKPGVLVAKLKKPVRFKEMGLNDNYVNAEYVFLLMINKDNHQVFLLQNMMNLCSDEKVCNKLKKAITVKEILDTILDFYSNNFEY